MKQDKKHQYNNMYCGYLCELRREEYLARVYVIDDTIAYKKEDGRFFDFTTMQILDVVDIGDDLKLNTQQEGIYLFGLVLYKKYLKNQEKLEQYTNPIYKSRRRNEK